MWSKDLLRWKLDRIEKISNENWLLYQISWDSNLRGFEKLTVFHHQLDWTNWSFLLDKPFELLRFYSSWSERNIHFFFFFKNLISNSISHSSNVKFVKFSPSIILWKRLRSTFSISNLLFEQMVTAGNGIELAFVGLLSKLMITGLLCHCTQMLLIA